MCGEGAANARHFLPARRSAWRPPLSLHKRTSLHVQTACQVWDPSRKRLWMNHGQELGEMSQRAPCLPQREGGSRDGVSLGEIWNLGSSNWQVFYRPEDHRRIDGHFLFLFLPFASFHSLAPHTFLSAGLRGRASH